MNLPRLATPGLEVAAESMADTITLRFRGNADMDSLAPLDEFLRAVHAESLARDVETVSVDFQALEFMSASVFKAFVAWLGILQELPERRRYCVAFESNGEMHWQRRSLSALRSFAMGIVIVDRR